MLRITWRLQRFGLVAMTLVGVFYGLFQAAAYNSAAGSTTAQRVAFGHQAEILGRSLTYLLPVPQHLETIGGYLQWRVFGALPILFVFWAVMSASGAMRGDEDKGFIEQWVSGGVGAVRYTAYRFAAFVLAAIVAAVATSAAIDAGVAQSGLSLDSGALLEMSLAVATVTVACYGITMVAAQLTSSRNATAGTAGVVVLAVFFVNSFSRSVDSLKPIAAVISPFYYYDRSNPLTPGGSFEAWATLGLFVAAVALATLAAWLMPMRDLGSSLLRRRSREAPPTVYPSANPLLRIPVLSSVYEQRRGLFAWTAGSVVLATYLASLGRPIVDDLVKGSTSFRAYLTLAGHGDPYVAITGYFWFGIFLALLSIFAVVQVSRWTADDNEGRLETVLSAPVSRTRVVLERAAALSVVTVVIVAISGIGFYVAAHAVSIDIQASDLVAASIPLIPFVLSFAAVGALLASRVPRVAVSVLVAIAFVSYVITEAAPLLKWPDWVLKLSVFYLYGQPLTNGIYWTGFWILLAITVVGFGLAVVLMQRREVGA